MTDDATLTGETLSAGPSSAPASATPVIGQGQVGRYHVLSKVGAGAMGMVFAAYDPELDRKVALKLLVPRGRDQASARLRLQREAQALAKLVHPNVVGVHDVGVHAGQLFVAMEFVEGQTLGEWMAEPGEPRDWRTVVRVLSEAGRGLAAAHEAGLVHRDFKPDNVMLGEDGRARVMDFGLARVSGDEATEASEAEGPVDALGLSATLADTLASAGGSESGGGSEHQLTRTGALMGTPGYMSNEQFEGRPADARSDQFGFCVTLYEALYGERPFAGSSVLEVLVSVGNAEIRDPPRGSKVPPWVRDVVVRGLARDPEARHASMAALLDALARDPAATRRKWALALVLGGALAGGAWGLSQASEPEPPACAGMDEKLAGVWDEERRAAVEAAFEQTGAKHAAETWVRVDRRLGDYSAAWVAARTEACEASERGEQSGELLDRRMACLDGRLDHVRALVEVLEQADQTVVNEAVRAAASLPGLERCADTEALLAAVAPPEDAEIARQVAALDEELARAVALERAGQYERGMSLIDDVLDEASTLEHPPLMARALLRQGTLHEELGAYEDAEASLVRAYEIAVAEQMSDEVAQILNTLMFLVSKRLARVDDALTWATHAKPWSEAVGTDLARVEYLNERGGVAFASSDYATAKAHHERALALCETKLADRPLLLAKTLNRMGGVSRMLGQSEEAQAFYARSLALLEHELGPYHPDLANLLNNLGSVVSQRGDWKAARSYRERALEIRERTLGPDHPLVAAVLINLGESESIHGDRQQARAWLERALEIRQAAFGPDHPSVAMSLGSLATLAHNEHRYDEALDYYERALAIVEATSGPEHQQAGVVHYHLGKLHITRRDYEAAHAALEATLRIFRANVGDDHPMVLQAMNSLGFVTIERSQHDEAVELLERALALGAGLGDQPLILARSRWHLSRALWDASEHRDRLRAVELVALARATFANEGDPAKPLVEKIDAWIAAHPL